MMKAGHLTTMTRNNGDRHSHAFNTRANRTPSPSSPQQGSANYYDRRSDVNFEPKQISGRTSPGDVILLENGQRREHSRPTESSTSPCSPRVAPDTSPSAPPSCVGRSASLRSSRRSDSERRGERDFDQQGAGRNRSPRRCGSARESSGERRRAEFVAASENYRYRERRCFVSNVDYKHHPPPTIVTTIDDPEPITPSESDSVDSYVQTHWASQQHLLTVPDYDSQTQILSPTLDDQSSTRSRSRSTPTRPDLHRGERKAVRQTRSEACSDRFEGDTEIYDDMHPAQSLYQRKSTPENYGFYPSRQVIDRRVSYDPARANDVDEAALAAAYREKTRKYSCADVRVYNEKALLSPKTGARGQQQPELRRLASSGAACSDTPRRRFLPPTPDEIIRRKQQQEKDEKFFPQVSSPTYLDVNYGDRRKPFLPPSSSLPGSEAAEEIDPASSPSVSSRRRTSGVASCGFLNDNDGRTCATIGPAREPIKLAGTRSAGRDMISRSSAPSNVARPGSGRKLPAEPTPAAQAQSSPSKAIHTRIFRQDAVAECRSTISRSDDLSRRSQPTFSVETHSKSSSSDDEESDWPSPPGTATLAPSSEASCKTAKLTPSNRSSSGCQGVFKRFHQSTVSSSSSVPDFQVTPCPDAPPCPAGPGPSTADVATDSGHGSGAESAVGDGAAVSASNSWPDAIVSGVVSTAKAPAAASLTSATQNADPASRRSSATISPPPSPSVGSLGFLHFGLQYFPVRKRLRVSVIKAELNLEADLNAFVKICLMPGKIQKQKGERIVKRSKEAVFNEEFFFDNVTSEDVETKSAYVRICHHAGKQFQKDVVIGQMEVALKDFHPILLGKQEVKMCQELKPKQLKKLGRLQISTCLEKEARRLTINIFKSDDLPKFGITGPPDPFVRVTVDQNGWVQTKQSRTLKNTCNAVFKEAIMFLVSTKLNDLERTKIVITVHDAARTASGNDVIGYVFLGQLASDKTEMEQWKNSMTHFGREFKATHQLKNESSVAPASEDRLSAEDDY